MTNVAIIPGPFLVAAAIMIGGTGAQQAVSTREMADVFSGLYSVYDTAGIIERYRTEHKAIPTASGPGQFARAVFNNAAHADLFVDPWGTPLHIESSPGKGYLIVSAGSDRKFDQTTWSERAATTTSQDDIVFRDGELVRSPVGWANAFLANARGLAESRDRLRVGDAYRVTASNLRALLSSLLTYQVVENKDIPAGDAGSLRAVLTPKYTNASAFIDGWGHPLFIAKAGSGYMLVSAGPNGKFDKESWNNTSRATDDITLDSDAKMRNADPPPQTDAAAEDTDRLLKAFGGYQAAVYRFNESRR